MTEPRSLPERDPFSEDAIAMSQRRLITTEAEREVAAPWASQLARDGYVVLENQLKGDALADAQAALDAINAETRLGIYEFEGSRTRRGYNVVSKSRAFDEMAMHRGVLAIIETYFGEAPQLSASMGMTLFAGQRAQPLHRDTGHYPLPWPRPPLEVNAIWALDDFRETNGATRFLPRSHQIPGEARPSGDAQSATMPAGSVMMYDGSLWHGGGECTEPGPRRSVNHIYARQWLRQQDNMYLSIPQQDVLAMPKVMQRLLGFWLYGFTLGVIDGRPPLDVLKERHRPTDD
ncbi:MAG: phytanoyl-CoA dioxygenase family protein [Pseudomonadota bacterium]